MARSTDIAGIVKRVRRNFRLERRVDVRGEVHWMTLDRSGSGNGIYGDEAAGRNNFEKIVMFRALERFDPEHDWHEYDWHTLSGTAEERCAQMLAWRAEWEQAVAETAPFRALCDAVMRSARA